MTNHKPQKYKEIRVPQEFFNQILIGFKNAEQQVNTKAKMPQYVPFHQSYFFKNRTLPIILKCADKSNLMYDWVSTTLERIKQQQQLALKRKFLKASNVADQMQEQLQETIEQQQNQKDGAFKGIRNALKMYDKVTSMLWAFRKGKILYDVLRQGVENKQNEATPPNVSDSAVNRQINKTMNESKDTIITSVQASTYPAIHAFSTKMHNLMADMFSKFWDSFVNNVLLPNSWEDAGWYCLAVLKGMGSAIIKGAAAAGASSAAGPGSIAVGIGVAIAYFPVQFLNARVGLKKTARQLKQAAEMQGWDSMTRYGEAVSTGVVSLLPSQFTWAKWAIRGAHAVNYSLKGMRGYAWFSELYQVTDTDVAHMRAEFTSSSRRWGQKVNSAFMGIASRLGKFELTAQQQAIDFQNEYIGQLDSIGTMNLIQKIYNTQISINPSKIVFSNDGQVKVTLQTVNESLIKLGSRIDDKLTNEFTKVTEKHISKELFTPHSVHLDSVMSQIESIRKLAELRTITIDGRQYEIQSKRAEVERLVGKSNEMFTFPQQLSYHYSSGAIVNVGAFFPFSKTFVRLLQGEERRIQRERERRNSPAAVPVMPVSPPNYIQASQVGLLPSPTLKYYSFQRQRYRTGHDTTGYAMYAPMRIRDSRVNSHTFFRVAQYHDTDSRIMRMVKISDGQGRYILDAGSNYSVRGNNSSSRGNSTSTGQSAQGTTTPGINLYVGLTEVFRFDEENYIWDLQLKLKDEQRKLLDKEKEYTNSLNKILQTLDKKFKK